MSERVLHIGTVCGNPVRFFKTPNDDGRPDLPWHSVDDLQRALGLNRSARKFFLRKLQSDWRIVRTVTTDSGLITIAPHFAAQGLISAMVETGRASPKAYADYALGGAAATEKLTAHLQFSSEEWLQFVDAALMRHEGEAS